MAVGNVTRGLPKTEEVRRQFITKVFTPANHVACVTADDIALVSVYVFISSASASVASMRCERSNSMLGKMRGNGYMLRYHFIE